MSSSKQLQVVLVRFKSARNPKSYAYFVPPWLEVEKLDVVVIEAKQSIALGEVVSVNPTPHAAGYASAYIIQVLDLQTHRDKINKLENPE